MTQDKRKTRPRRVAITGIHTDIGGRMLYELDIDSDIELVVAIDINPPTWQTPKLKYREIDLIDPSADEELSEILKYHQVDTFIHAGLLSNPSHRTYYAHELEVIGTMHVLNACAEARLCNFILPSRTMVYGAHPGNPNYLTETHPLRGERTSRWVRDKVEAEKQVATFARENPECAVCVLRLATILGPGLYTFMNRYLSRQVVPVVAGYDPLFQFLHMDDAARAMKLVMERRIGGIYNIVGRGVIPLSSVLALGGRIPLPIPHFVLYPLTGVLWGASMTAVPSVFINYFRFMWVAAGEKARDELGFEAKYSSAEVLAEYYRARGIDVKPLKDTWLNTEGVADEL